MYRDIKIPEGYEKQVELAHELESRQSALDAHVAKHRRKMLEAQQQSVRIKLTIQESLSEIARLRMQDLQLASAVQEARLEIKRARDAWAEDFRVLRAVQKKLRFFEGLAASFGRTPGGHLEIMRKAKAESPAEREARYDREADEYFEELDVRDAEAAGDHQIVQLHRGMVMDMTTGVITYPDD